MMRSQCGSSEQSRTQSDWQGPKQQSFKLSACVFPLQLSVLIQVQDLIVGFIQMQMYAQAREEQYNVLG
jgi:hypothetical protein